MKPESQIHNGPNKYRSKDFFQNAKWKETSIVVDKGHGKECNRAGSEVASLCRQGEAGTWRCLRGKKWLKAQTQSHRCEEVEEADIGSCRNKREYSDLRNRALMMNYKA